MDIIRVLAFPDGQDGRAIKPGAIYLRSYTENNVELLEVGVANQGGTDIVVQPGRYSGLDKVVEISDEMPTFPCVSPFWINSDDEDFRMCVQYKTGDGGHAWVDLQAFMQTLIVEFDGTGESEKAARADHNHDDRYTIDAGNHQW